VVSGSKHLVQFAKPARLAKAPAGHLAHLLVPTPLAKVPTSQGSHKLDPVGGCPMVVYGMGGQ